MNTRSPLECPAWAKLAQHAESWRAVHLRELFAADAARGRQLVAEAPGVRYDYSRQRLGAITLRLLAHLAAARSTPARTAPPGTPRCAREKRRRPR
jgi:glucose-6-phosphate isomerase